MGQGVPPWVGVSVVGGGDPMGFYAGRRDTGCRKWGIPSHGFGEPPFWGDLRGTEVDTWFKMYANGCYWEADLGEDDP